MPSMDTRSAIIVEGRRIPLTVIFYDPDTGRTERGDGTVLDERMLHAARWMPDVRGGYLLIIDVHDHD